MWTQKRWLLSKESKQSGLGMERIACQRRFSTPFGHFICAASRGLLADDGRLALRDLSPSELPKSILNN
jgi:hypothetical protein